MANRPFEEHRYVGDKRTMIFHDLSAEAEECEIDGIVEYEAIALFGPDQPSEARNRGYSPCVFCQPPVEKAG